MVENHLTCSNCSLSGFFFFFRKTQHCLYFEVNGHSFEFQMDTLPWSKWTRFHCPNGHAFFVWIDTLLRSEWKRFCGLNGQPFVFCEWTCFRGLNGQAFGIKTLLLLWSEWTPFCGKNWYAFFVVWMVDNHLNCSNFSPSGLFFLFQEDVALSVLQGKWKRFHFSELTRFLGPNGHASVVLMDPLLWS